MTRRKKIFLLLTGIPIILLIATALLISPIAKYAIEKNSKEWTGRIIRMDDLSINLFTGSLSIKGLEMKEADDKTPFFTCHSIATSIRIFPAIAGNFILPGTAIQGLSITFTQNGEHFNFDDLLARFATTDSTVAPEKDTSSSKFTIQNFRLEGTSITYRQVNEKIEIPITHLQVLLPEFSDDSRMLNLTYGFEFATGGKFSGSWQQDLQTNDYTLGLICQGFNLKLMEQYLRPFIRLHSLQGKVDSDIQILGNLDRTSQVIAKGNFQLKDMIILDPKQQPLMRAGLLDMQFDSINTGNNYFTLDYLKLDNYYVRYEVFDTGDNWTSLMTQDSASAEEVDTLDYSNPFRLLALYMDLMMKEYSASQFYANNITVNNAEVIYTDYTLPDPFTFRMDQCSITINDLNTSADRIIMNAQMRLNQTGMATAMLSVNPGNAKDLDLEWNVEKFPFSSFNPYMNYFVGYLFTNGDANYTSTISIRDGILNSTNHFVLVKPTVNSAIKNPLYKLPLKLAISLLKNPKGNIDLEIPVEGNLNDPEYKIRKAVWKILGNIITKAVTAPYNLIAKAGGDSTDLGDLSDFSLKYTSTNFTTKQKQKLKPIVKGLLSKPELFVTITQEYDSLAEIDALSTVEARRRFALENGILSATDTNTTNVAMMIDSISTKDTAFVNWLIRKTGNDVESQTQKCIRLIGLEELTILQQRMVQTRNNNLISALDDEGFPKYRYTFTDNKSKQLPPGINPRFSYTVGDYPPGHAKE